MAISILAHIGAASQDNHSVTTAGAPKDTTGASLILLATAATSLPLVPQDNLGNIYTPITPSEGGVLQVWECQNPINGPGHFWSMAGNPFTDPSICVLVLAGTLDNALDQQSGGTGAQPGSITPSEDGEIVITAMACNGVPAGVDSGFTVSDSVSSSSAVGLALATQIQTAAAAENPTWSVVGGSTLEATFIASFKANPSPPPPPSGPLTLTCASSAATQGTAYSSALIASGGTAPYTFSLFAGLLPIGLTLDPATGDITGTPTTPGVTAYTGQVTDSLGAFQRATCAIIVTPAVVGGCTIIVGSGLSRALNILTAKQFSAEREKGLAGMPIDVYLDQNAPNSGFHVWPVPNLAYIIEFYYWAVLQQFVAVTDTLALPPAYYDALVWNLAMALCPSYRRPVPPSVLAIAAKTKKTVMELNAQILDGSYHQSRTLAGPNEGEPKPKALGPPEPTLLPGATDTK